jgi:serine phosphatase RsbU (regulator of sigma subunit)
MDLDWKINIRPLTGLPRGGDMGVVIRLEDGALAALIDASGHGLAAYSVAQTARNTILNSSTHKPDVLLIELDNALRGSIGAAISVARIHLDTIEFAGVGNVNASIGLKPLLVRTGVVGLRMRTPTLVSTSLPPDSWFLMHTDGVSRPKSIPNGNAETAAKTLMESNASGHDDAGILLARWRETL